MAWRARNRADDLREARGAPLGDEDQVRERCSRCRQLVTAEELTATHAVDGLDDYTCGACLEHFGRTGGRTRDQVAAQLGAPSAVVEKFARAERRRLSVNLV